MTALLCRTALVAFTLTLLALGATASSARAEPGDRVTAPTPRTSDTQAQRAQRAKPAQRTAPARVKVLTFGDGDELTAAVLGPDGVTVTARPEVVQSNLIRLRRDFLPEIYRTALRL